MRKIYEVSYVPKPKITVIVEASSAREAMEKAENIGPDLSVTNFIVDDARQIN